MCGRDVEARGTSDDEACNLDANDRTGKCSSADGLPSASARPPDRLAIGARAGSSVAMLPCPCALPRAISSKWFLSRAWQFSQYLTRENIGPGPVCRLEESLPGGSRVRPAEAVLRCSWPSRASFGACARRVERGVRAKPASFSVHRLTPPPHCGIMGLAMPCDEAGIHVRGFKARSGLLGCSPCHDGPFVR